MPDPSQAASEPLQCLEALRSRVERMLDSEMLLPADGQALLDMLQQAQERVARGEAAAAGGLLIGFEALLRALAESGVLDRSAADLCVVDIRSLTEALSA